jgi:hypothetical protein
LAGRGFFDGALDGFRTGADQAAHILAGLVEDHDVGVDGVNSPRLTEAQPITNQEANDQ